MELKTFFTSIPVAISDPEDTDVDAIDEPEPKKKKGNPLNDKKAK